MMHPVQHRVVHNLRLFSSLILIGLVFGAPPALAAGDPAMGARLFLQCRACHAVAPQEPAGVGPNLYGVVGATAGKRPGYAYSPALSASGIVWSADTLDRWLTEPTALVPGTKMAFAGVASAKARQSLIAYLASLTPTKP